jgi:serine/threonine protein kinase
MTHANHPNHPSHDAANGSSQVFARTKPSDVHDVHDARDTHDEHEALVQLEHDHDNHEEAEATELDASDAVFDDDSDAEQAIESNVVDLDPLIGTLIAGKYRVLRLLGRGSTGAVYLCQHLGLDKPVALKILHREMEQNAGFVEGFKLEAQAASRLEHPNSVRVLDFGEDANGALFIVMEYVEGRDLLRVLEEDGPFSAERAIDVMSQILDALSVAHSLGIVHRDLKPENVVVRTLVIDGVEKELVTVCDFGIAQFSATRLGASTSTVEVGMVVGTPAYMPPEQARAEEQDARSDIYSAGVVLFQLLTLHLPFEADDAMAVAYKHCSEPPPRPSQFGAVSPVLEEICLKALSKTREARYQTAREMRNALQRALIATPLPRPRPGLRWGNGSTNGRPVQPGQPAALPPAMRPDAARPEWKAPGSLRPQEIFVSPKVTDQRRLSRRLGLGFVALVVVGSTAGLLQHAHVFDSDSSPSAATTSIDAASTRDRDSNDLHGAHVVRPQPVQPVEPAEPASSSAPAAQPSNSVATPPATPSPVEPNVLAVSDGPAPAPSIGHGPTPVPMLEPNERETDSARPSDAHPARSSATTRPAPVGKSSARASSADSSHAGKRVPKSTKPVSTPDATPPTEARIATASTKSHASDLDSLATGLLDSPPPSAATSAASAAKLVEPQPIAANTSAQSEPRSQPTALQPAADKPTKPQNPELAAVPERARVEIQGINVRAASKAGVRSALNMGAISGCYRSALRSGDAPATAVTADMELLTSTTGGVTSATLRAPELGTELRRCIEQVARRGRVRDTDTGEVQASISLAFAPR